MNILLSDMRPKKLKKLKMSFENIKKQKSNHYAFKIDLMFLSVVWEIIKWEAGSVL